METRCVRDIMIPLREYAVVSETETLADVIASLQEAASRLGADRQPPRAVLVIDDHGRVLRQLGYLEFLKALEPKYRLLGDLDMLSRAGVRSEVINSLTEQMQLLPGGIEDACHRARDVLIRDIMRPITESIDEGAPLSEAVHKFVVWQTPRILVTRHSEVVGVLRLADLCAVLFARIGGGTWE
jgi:CBS domain-containing protein